jgi:hypothetical protein
VGPKAAPLTQSQTCLHVATGLSVGRIVHLLSAESAQVVAEPIPAEIDAIGARQIAETG